MCGIWAVFGLQSNMHTQCATGFSKITHRGPDAWRVEYYDRLKHCCVGFHRLTIVDSTYGMQPMKLHAYPHSMLLCNGELYNFARIEKQFGFTYETRCDVECIFHLYEQFGIEKCVENLDGVFAFCIIDVPKGKIFLARDPYGVRPMFRVASNESGVLALCSEAKGLISTELSKHDASLIHPFPPGTFEEYNILPDGKGAVLVRSVRFHRPGDAPKFQMYVSPDCLKPTNVLENIRILLEAAVRKRLMADRRIGCLLSGGLDSSLIAALLVQEAKKAKIPYKIQSFAIGMDNSPDIIAARQVAKHIGTDHHEVLFTEEDVCRVLDDVIYTLETYDITTVRASIPMYLIARYIKENTETTVLFSGEGADELAQGYIYFRDAPDAQSAHEDSIRLLNEIYMFDGLRADRTTSAFSLELRVPFLDLQFTNYFLNLSNELRQPKDGLEKHLLRSAFDQSDLLPSEILWRPKEAFSDGVTSKKRSLFQVVQDLVEKRMPEQFDGQQSKVMYSHCSPSTKEALYYREIFEKSYPKLAANFTKHYWMPRWVEGITDPSARFINHYSAATD